MPFFGGGGGAVSNMVGATSSVAGTAGLVPAPAAGDQGKVLTGGATFGEYDRMHISGTLATGEFFVSGTGVSASRGVGQFEALRFSPIYIVKRSTFSEIGIYYFSGGGANAKFRTGLYKADGTNEMPYTLIDQGSEQSKPGSGGILSSAFTGGNLTLEKGVYWGVSWWTADSTNLNIHGPNASSTDAQIVHIFYGKQGGNYTNSNWMLRKGKNYSASGLSATETVDTTNIVSALEAPTIFLKYA